MHPTDEQSHAVELFSRGAKLKINAFAGTGKTTTLSQLAHSTSRAGIYLAFNKSIANDAKGKFPQSIDCRTTHSMAFRATPAEYKRSSGKMTTNLNVNAVASLLDLKPLQLSANHALSPRSQAYWIVQTLRSFMQGANPQLTINDVRLFGRVAAIPGELIKPMRERVLGWASGMWELMTDASGPAPLGHDGYLKLWALSNPQIAADYILLDEAQDSNAVILDVLAKQQAQVVYVGDKYQQIYEWRGAINAMERVETDHSASLTQSFRFGSAIAEAATQLIAHLGEKETIRGTSSVQSKLGCADPRAILCRTNAGVITNLLDAQNQGRSAHIVGGTEEPIRLLRAVTGLKQGMASDTPEFFGFANWGEVVEFSQSEEGQHLKTFVNIVQQHGEQYLIQALQRTADSEAAAELIISTAHKAKGREWERVLVADDFFLPKADEDGNITVDPSEVRLLYVALTRAQHEVQIPTALADFFNVEQAAVPRLIKPRPTPTLERVKQPAPVQRETPATVAQAASSPQKDSSYCFVATAAYGDRNHPHVCVLRTFRDEVLVRSATGRAFIVWYFAVGPHLGSIVSAFPLCRVLVRCALTLLVRVIGSRR